ncbi:hypothetical protein D3C72_2174350 [compost metagenome]
MSSCNNGDCAGNGSCTNTSRPAPRMRRARNASISAGSSTTRPREMFTRIAWGFISANSRAPIRPSVLALSGTVRQTKSACCNSSSRLH